jgi:aminoglycoside/choline kinase family phosphotransferase
MVTAAFPASRDSFRFEPMPGGASTRRYFRIQLGTGVGANAGPHAGIETAVAMFVPEGACPEEIVKDGQLPAARWPFLEVRDLLASRGIDVPVVFAEATANGWLLLEDLGDETLSEFLLRHPERKEGLYVRAVTDLARAQASLNPLPQGSVVARRAFDHDLLYWEIQHFREWALDARGVSLSPEQRAAFDGFAERLAHRIAELPRGFVHRDFQSRNLMVRPDGRLCWIDFQDALLGPRVYDLVALLNDSYQIFERSFVEARLDDYARTAGLAPGERTQLGSQFDLVTVQRKLKDAGRFVFIDRAKGNAAFLRFVEPTIVKALTSAARLAKDGDNDMRMLGEMLDHVLTG